MSRPNPISKKPWNQNPAPKPLSNCGKCGLCLAACPVYQTLKEEQASPRARLRLIKAFETGQLNSSPLLKEIISKCLMCGSCAKACPSGINHYEAFMEMRRKMVQAQGEIPAIKALVFLLAREFRLRAGARLAGAGQRITPAFLSDKYRLGNIPVSRFPRLNAKPFRKTLDQVIPAEPGRPFKGQILYFTGCATEYMFADTGNAVVDILTGLGYAVVIPKELTCCAIPLLFHGAQTQAVHNIKTNLRAMAGKDVSHIIVDCTTCGAALKDEYPAFIQRQKKEDPGNAEEWAALEKQARMISRKTVDIMGFLAKEDMAYKRLAPHLGRAVYHAPCHSRNSFDTLDRVRGLLKGLPNLEYIPTAQEDQCCGGGGTFFYEYPEVARAMIEKKKDQVKPARPNLWLTDCPVCRINLAGNLAGSKAPKVCHPVVPISRALKGKYRENLP